MDTDLWRGNGFFKKKNWEQFPYWCTTVFVSFHPIQHSNSGFAFRIPKIGGSLLFLMGGFFPKGWSVCLLSEQHQNFTESVPSCSGSKLIVQFYSFPNNVSPPFLPDSIVSYGEKSHAFLGQRNQSLTAEE